MPDAVQDNCVRPEQGPLYTANPIPVVVVPVVATRFEKIKMTLVCVAVVVNVYQTSSLPELFAQNVVMPGGAEMVAPVVTTDVVAAQEPLGFIVVAKAPAQSLFAGWAKA
jgi:hypothetical protein